MYRMNFIVIFVGRIEKPNPPSHFGFPQIFMNFSGSMQINY